MIISFNVSIARFRRFIRRGAIFGGKNHGRIVFISHRTWGIISSGLITTRQAISVLTEGPLYEQTVVKTQKALSQLCFDSSRVLPAEEIGKYRDAVREEEAAYQQMIASRLGDLSELLG